LRVTTVPPAAKAIAAPQILGTNPHALLLEFYVATAIPNSKTLLRPALG
jgi:hypothetical protein